MLQIALGILLLVGVFLGALLLEGYVSREGRSMDERRAVVFEIYRYTVCFVMIVVFGLCAFLLVGSLIADASNPQGLAGPGVGVLLSTIIFLAHWTLKNPAHPKTDA